MPRGCSPSDLAQILREIQAAEQEGDSHRGVEADSGSNLNLRWIGAYGMNIERANNTR